MSWDLPWPTLKGNITMKLICIGQLNNYWAPWSKDMKTMGCLIPAGNLVARHSETNTLKRREEQFWEPLIEPKKLMNPEEWKAYKDAPDEFKKVVSKAKREIWQTFFASIEDFIKWSKWPGWWPRKMVHSCGISRPAWVIKTSKGKRIFLIAGRRQIRLQQQPTTISRKSYT